MAVWRDPVLSPHARPKGRALSFLASQCIVWSYAEDTQLIQAQEGLLRPRRLRIRERRREVTVDQDTPPLPTCYYLQSSGLSRSPREAPRFNGILLQAHRLL